MTNKKTRWFNFRQNNSGGRFCEPAINVWVEAHNAEEANKRAGDVGIYFDGAGDCPCCGDRWHEQWGDEKGEAECPKALAPRKHEDLFAEDDKVPRAVRFGFGDMDPVVIPVDTSLPADNW